MERDRRLAVGGCGAIFSGSIDFSLWSHAGSDPGSHRRAGRNLQPRYFPNLPFQRAIG